MLIIKNLTEIKELDRKAMSSIAGGFQLSAFDLSELNTASSAADDPRLPDVYLRPPTLMERIRCAENGHKC